MSYSSAEECDDKREDRGESRHRAHNRAHIETLHVVESILQTIEARFEASDIGFGGHLISWISGKVCHQVIGFGRTDDLLETRIQRMANRLTGSHTTSLSKIKPVV